MNELIDFGLFFILIVDLVVGLAFMLSLYKNNFTILAGVKTILFCPIWFLFLDEYKRKALKNLSPPVQTFSDGKLIVIGFGIFAAILAIIRPSIIWFMPLVAGFVFPTLAFFGDNFKKEFKNGLICAIYFWIIYLTLITISFGV